jgi:hypothetical protein
LLTREVLSGGQVKQIASGQPLEALPAASDQLDQSTTIPETERSPVVPPLGKPLPQE